MMKGITWMKSPNEKYTPMNEIRFKDEKWHERTYTCNVNIYNKKLYNTWNCWHFVNALNLAIEGVSSTYECHLVGIISL